MPAYQPRQKQNRNDQQESPRTNCCYSAEEHTGAPMVQHKFGSKMVRKYTMQRKMQVHPNGYCRILPLNQR